MKRNNSFIRFCLSGVFFTTLGPGLLWLAYPLGAFLAVGISELLAHSLQVTPETAGLPLQRALIVRPLR
jgi:hypothetical protein